MPDLTLAANNGAIGGGEVMLLLMAKLARELGLEVAIVAPDDSAVARRADELGFPTTGIRGRNRSEYIPNLRRWDRRERDGLLWCHGLVPALATTGHPHRVVQLHQRPRSWMAGAAGLVAAAGSTKAVVPSEFMRSRLPGTTALPNWTAPLDVIARPREEGAPVVLGFIGRLSPDKGILVLAEAVRQLDERHPGKVRLLLAGEPLFVNEEDQRRVEEALAPLAPITDRRGWMDRCAFFAAVDLAVFPSVWGEPFGLVVAEAMAAGVPFVISDAGALPEVAGPEHPWVAHTADPQSLAETIEGAVVADQTEIVACARRRWETHFSPDAARERLRILFTELGVLSVEAGR
ncbi:glycosyltransferase family 4 protein [Raineyella sp. W15-4]|uniref:glycosyltransferase family 4 protein n=1 Tax=Raineyella sp. W15-4 TaxID=3081651 RepID=UPI00295379F7|nr:glycosyltransferase family 4 protein [Raineyella sp. W15-4]WOQ16430.1 glycosyltransferase family 4 protein [Raineyella sp. W15-4]